MRIQSQRQKQQVELQLRRVVREEVLPLLLSTLRLALVCTPMAMPWICINVE
jgi:hypothetical protein